ncbi:MAG: lysophospholipid acyltransferase family protein [Lentisphaeria bacterium]|nr:lysophospholipid acyltransferase family protein [Lentisphaeria bacterium]
MTFLVDIVLWIFRPVPLRARVWLGCVVGWFLHSVLRLRRKVVTEQIGWAFPELDDGERAGLIRRVYRHFGLLGLEYLRMAFMSSEDVIATCQVKGRENLDKAHAKGRGVFILGAHDGAWELGASRGALLGYDTSAVLKEIKGSLGQYAVDRLRQTNAIEAIPRRNSVRQILRALKSGRLVGFVLDQNMTSDEGVFVDFFGKPACTMAGLAVLSQRAGAAVVPAHNYRNEDLRAHTVEFLPEVEWEEPYEDKEQNILHNTQRYTTILENMIRRHPEQWNWLHKRWKTKPDPSTGNLADEATKEQSA